MRPPDLGLLEEERDTVALADVAYLGDPFAAHGAAYRAHPAFDPGHRLSFTSYYGGVPKHPNPFRHKSSRFTLGMLKALRAPSKSVRHYTELSVNRPWDAISTHTAPLPVPGSFEVYPNRDSLLFMDEYGFDPAWTVKDFVRGTLRLNEWAEVFREVETLEGTTGDARLKEMSDRFWDENAYDEGEPDRVVRGCPGRC